MSDDLAVDFTVTTSLRAPTVLLELAYDYARKNHKDRVSVITKANVIKITDGKFLNLCKEIGKGISRNHNRRLVYRHNHRKAHRQKAPYRL